MKKVLIIANLYHACPRIPGVTTYLPEFGWQATIITPPLGSDAEARLGFPKKFIERTKIIEAPYKGDIFWFWRKIFKLLSFKTDESITEQIKKYAGITPKRSFIDVLMRWYQTIFAFPDTERTWEKAALNTVIEALKTEQFDAILSSSPFPTSHIIAACLKVKTGLPWIADFRDPWTQNHNYPYGPIRKFFDKRLELKTLALVDYMTAASPSYAKKQETLHKKPCISITNGFDPEMLNEKHSILVSKKFTITYTGTAYKGKQDPSKVFIAVRDLIIEKIIKPEDIEIRFYGAKQTWLDMEIKKYNLQNIAFQYGLLPKSEIFLKQKESQILLLLCWEDKKETGVYPLKTFEYLAAQRPILATGGSENEDIKKIIMETEAGICAISTKEIKKHLLYFYNEYKNTGRVHCQVNSRKIEKYSYREMAKKFAEVLDKITKA